MRRCFRKYVYAAVAGFIAIGCDADQREASGAEEQVQLTATLPFPAFTSTTPTSAELSTALSAVKAATMGPNGLLIERNFRPAGGDAQYIEGIGGVPVYATIIPHRKSASPQLENGKPLALIDSDGETDALHLRTGRNFWIAARTTTGEWFSIMVSIAKDSAFAVAMTPLPHNDEDGEEHKQGAARWVVSNNGFRASEERSWATCSSNECCCSGSSCELKFAHN